MSKLKLLVLFLLISTIAFAQATRVHEGTVSAPSGTASAPPYTFIGDTNTGIFRSSADTFSSVTNGVARFTWTNDGDYWSQGGGQFLANGGTAGAPDYSWSTDTGENTGFYLGGQNEIAVANNGVQSARFISNGALIINNVGNTSTTRAATTPNLQALNGSNSIFFGHSNTAYNGVLGAFSNAGGPFVGGHFYHDSSANGLRRSGTNTPSLIQFSPGGGMIFYADPAGSLDASYNPTERMNIDDTGEIYFGGGSTGDGLIQISEGSTGSPTYSFAGDADSGFDRRGANDEVAIVTGGTERLRVLSNGAVVITAGGGGGGNVIHTCTYDSDIFVASSSVFKSCSAGQIITAGGCGLSTGALRINRPEDIDTWRCDTESGTATITISITCCEY